DFLLALALAFVLLGVLFLASSQLVLLESWKSPLALLYGLTIGFGFLFAWRFLKALRQESWETAWIAALLFAAAVGFLTAALAPRLPLWLGEERRETFALQEANRRYPEQQTWHAAQDKGSLLPRSFRYKLPKEHPRPEPGAKREFTLRCFLGLCAMSQGELKPLWEQESEDRDRGSGNRKSGEGAFPSEATGNPPADATRKE
ncbi:MAG: hypothetical protein LBO00_07895, partial [Zoogloeaceae bacterium]|nr:hypothetical protein [Zoogloeaceae bacterium]